MKIELEYFTPSEAGEITGINAASQRNWRARGYLPGNNSGHARFDVFDLSEIMFKAELSKRGIGPSQTREIAHISGMQISRCIAKQSILSGGEYDGLDGIGLIQKLGFDAADPLLKMGIAAGTLMKLYPDRANPHELYLSGQERMAMGNVFLWFADDTEYFAFSREEAYKNLQLDEHSPKLAGPVLFLELDNVAARMIEAAPRPLIRVSM